LSSEDAPADPTKTTPATAELAEAYVVRATGGRPTRTGGAYNVSDLDLRRILRAKQEEGRNKRPTTKYPKVPNRSGSKLPGYASLQDKLLREKEQAATKAMSLKERELPSEDNLRRAGTVVMRKVKDENGKEVWKLDRGVTRRFRTRRRQGFGPSGGLVEPDTGSYPFKVLDERFLFSGDPPSSSQEFRDEIPDRNRVPRSATSYRGNLGPKVVAPGDPEHMVAKDAKGNIRWNGGNVVYVANGRGGKNMAGIKGVQHPSHTMPRYNPERRRPLDTRAYVELTGDAYEDGRNRREKARSISAARATKNYETWKKIQKKLSDQGVSLGSQTKGPSGGAATGKVPAWLREVDETMATALTGGSRAPKKAPAKNVDNGPDPGLEDRTRFNDRGIGVQAQSSKPTAPRTLAGEDKKARARALAKALNVTQSQGRPTPKTKKKVRPTPTASWFYGNSDFVRPTVNGKTVVGPPREVTMRRTKAKADNMVGPHGKAFWKAFLSNKAAGAKSVQVDVDLGKGVLEKGSIKNNEDNFSKTSKSKSGTSANLPGDGKTEPALSEYKGSGNSKTPMVSDEAVKGALAERRGQLSLFSKPAVRRTGEALGGAAIPLTAYTAIKSKDKGEKAVASGDTAAMLASFTKYGKWIGRGGGVPLTAAMLFAEGVVSKKQKQKLMAELNRSPEGRRFLAQESLKKRLRDQDNADRFAKGKAPRRYRQPKFGPMDKVTSDFYKKKREIGL